MFSLDGYRPVDLSPRLQARVYRVDGTLEEGNTDPYGKPWVMKEGRFPADNSLFTLYAAPGDADRIADGREVADRKAVAPAVDAHLVLVGPFAGRVVGIGDIECWRESPFA